MGDVKSNLSLLRIRSVFYFRKIRSSKLGGLSSKQKCRPLDGTINLICGGGGIRTPGTRKRTPVFKTGAFNQLCHSSKLMIIQTSSSLVYSFDQHRSVHFYLPSFCEGRQPVLLARPKLMKTNIGGSIRLFNSMSFIKPIFFYY